MRLTHVPYRTTDHDCASHTTRGTTTCVNIPTYDTSMGTLMHRLCFTVTSSRCADASKRMMNGCVGMYTWHASCALLLSCHSLFYILLLVLLLYCHLDCKITPSWCVEFPHGIDGTCCAGGERHGNVAVTSHHRTSLPTQHIISYHVYVPDRCQHTIHELCHWVAHTPIDDTVCLLTSTHHTSHRCSQTPWSSQKQAHVHVHTQSERNTQLSMI